MCTKGIILDLDGTLLYTLEDLRTALNRMLTVKGLPLVTREQALANINSGARAFVRSSLPAELRQDAAFAEEAYQEYDRQYQACYQDTTVPYDGVPEALRLLAQTGIPMAVFSNKQDRMTKGLIRSLFPDIAFAAVQGHPDRSDPLWFPTKPDPAGALYLAETFLRSDPSHTIVVGDSDVDMALAANAGMIPVGVSWGYRSEELLLQKGARAVAHTPAELKDLLLSL